MEEMYLDEDDFVLTAVWIKDVGASFLLSVKLSLLLVVDGLRCARTGHQNLL